MVFDFNAYHHHSQINLKKLLNQCHQRKKGMMHLRSEPKKNSVSRIAQVRLQYTDFCFIRTTTVNLCSKGPSRKGNPLLRSINLSPNIIFFSYSYIAYKGILVYGMNLSSPMKSLRAKFNCILICIDFEYPQLFIFGLPPHT